MIDGYLTPTGEELATRGTRLVAAIVDGVIIMLIIVPLVILLAMIGLDLGEGLLANVVSTIFGIVAFSLVHGLLLISRGQTIGKMLFGIQIVDQESGKLLPPVRVLVIRYFWMMPLSVLTWFVPVLGTLVGLAGLVDALMIFNTDRLCLHDRLAKSKVVLFTQNRGKLDS